VLLQLQQGRVKRALIDAQLFVADLLDPARNLVSVERTHGIERLEDHQIERAMQDVGLF
jgi:hypothetical protein